MRKFVALIFIFSLPVSSFALGLRIDKSKIKLVVQEGQSVSGFLTVTNLANKKIKVKVYLQDFEYVYPFDGSKKFYPLNTTPYSLDDWIKFSPSEFSLPPNSQQKVSYILRVPSKMDTGHYGVMFFETELGQGRDAQGRAVTLLGRIGVLFFIEPQQRLKKARVENIFVQGNAIKGDFLNKGNVALIAKGYFSVIDKKGLVVERGKTNDIYIFPQAKAEFTAPISEDLTPAKYDVIFTFDLEDGDTLVKEITIEKSLETMEIREVRD